MVMRSFKCKSITIPVTKSKIARYTKRLQKELGDRIKIIAKTNEITVESVDESLSDYRIHDKVIYILTGGKYGKNV